MMNSTENTQLFNAINEFRKARGLSAQAMAETRWCLRTGKSLDLLDRLLAGEQAGKWTSHDTDAFEAFARDWIDKTLGLD